LGLGEKRKKKKDDWIGKEKKDDGVECKGD